MKKYKFLHKKYGKAVELTNRILSKNPIRFSEIKAFDTIPSKEIKCTVVCLYTYSTFLWFNILFNKLVTFEPIAWLAHLNGFKLLLFWEENH